MNPGFCMFFFLKISNTVQNDGAFKYPSLLVQNKYNPQLFILQLTKLIYIL